jgi:hypothetical protein
MTRTLGAVSAILLLPAALAAPPADQPTVADLISKGEKTAELVYGGTGHFSWSTRLLAKDHVFQVDNLVAGDRRRSVVKLVQSESLNTELFSIVVLGDAWYVREGGKPLGKYRPLEAPIGFPGAYGMLAAGDLHFLSDDVPAEVVSVTGDVATVERRRSARAKSAVHRYLEGMREMREKIGNAEDAETYELQIAVVEEVLSQSEPITVDVDTGIILSSKVLWMECAVISISANAAIPADAFSVGDGPWRDETDDPTLVKDRNDLLTALNAPLADPDNWKRVGKAAQLMLVDLSEKRLRRVPFPGVEYMAGSFSRDRRAVYIAGLNPVEAGFAVYEINLSRGTCRRIGSDELPSGLTTGPVVSPDGKTLALVLFNANLKSQIYLVDVETGRCKALGAPMDTGIPSWLDDGSGLVTAHRINSFTDQTTDSSVARIDLNGKVTMLTEGNNPIVIPGRNRILFEQDNIWKTCDLDGQNVELYADGMESCGFPAVCPDGRRIIWMKYEDGHMPQPVIQDYGSKRVEKLDLGPGCWVLPAWR